MQVGRLFGTVNNKRIIMAAVLVALGLVFTAQPAKASHTTTCEIIDGTRVCTPEVHPNSPPTVNLDSTNNIVVTEGITASKTGTYSDPDGNATVTLKASVGTVTENVAGGTWSWTFPTADGPRESQTVTITATDAAGDTATVSFGLIVNNRNPVVMTLDYPSSLNEGGMATIRLLNPSDAPADTNAGFRYAFACNGGSLDGATYANSGTSNSASCAYDDSGTKTAFARIIDKDGGFTQYGRSIMVNNVAPTATFNAPASVDYGNDLTLSLTNASDPSNADEAGLTYAFDCGDGAGYGAASSAASKTCTTIDQSTMRAKGKVIDKDGGVNEYTANVTVNNVKPTVSLTSPAAGAYVQGTVPLRATASDNVGVTHVQFYAERGSHEDGTHQSWIENDSTAPYAVLWDSTQFPDGPVAVEAGAFDALSNEVYHSYEVIVDNTAPVGSVKINGGAAYTRSAAVNLSLSGTDPSAGSGVASVRFSNDGKSWSAWQGYATSKSWTLASGSGTRTVHVQYRDKAGNVSTTARDAITLDIAKPAISGMSPRHKAVIRDTTPTIKATVKDNRTLSKANIKLYVAGKRISAAKFRYSASGLLVYNSPKLTKGKKTVRIVATDAVGNVGAKSWFFTIK